MTTPLSLNARKARLQGLRDHLDAAGPARMDFYTGTSLPATPEADPASTDTLLGSVALDTPVSGAIGASGSLATYTVAVPRTGTAVGTGVVGWVRLRNGAGQGVLDSLVVKAPATGPVVLSDTQVYAGGELQLVACVLSE